MTVKAPKYGFTGRRKKLFGEEIREIVALRDFGTFKKGDVGGWIASENNLSQEGNCWLGPDCYALEFSRVADNAYISGFDTKLWGRAKVCGDARVSGNSLSLLADSVISGNAVVKGGFIQLFGHSQICGNAVVYGQDVKLIFSADVKDNAYILGYELELRNNCNVTENSMIIGTRAVLKANTSFSDHALFRCTGLHLLSGSHVGGYGLIHTDNPSGCVTVSAIEGILVKNHDTPVNLSLDTLIMARPARSQTPVNSPMVVP